MYPIRTRGKRIRHYTPGRIWNSLYTWDSGFVGLGLLQYDRERAKDCLNCYLSDPNDPEHAYPSWQSVPTQFHLFQAIWNTS